MHLDVITPVTLSKRQAIAVPAGCGGRKPLVPSPKFFACGGMPRRRPPGSRTPPAFICGATIVAASAGATAVAALNRRTFWAVPVRSAQATATVSVFLGGPAWDVTVTVRV
ncbi:MAG: hypothetical protein IPM15_18395 [Betaproteobacteria bacterium]|nr:hypothetical protein [Betaproteobacteria bacterium]